MSYSFVILYKNSTYTAFLCNFSFKPIDAGVTCHTPGAVAVAVGMSEDARHASMFQNTSLQRNKRNREVGPFMSVHITSLIWITHFTCPSHGPTGATRKIRAVPKVQCGALGPRGSTQIELKLKEKIKK